MESVAVAGRKGAAFFNMKRRKWVLFGNPHQEQEFSCRGGLAWHSGHLLIACQTTSGAHELRAYRDTLDNSHMSARMSFPHRIVRLSTFGSYILLVLANRCVCKRTRCV